MVKKALVLAAAAATLLSLGCVSRTPFFMSGNATQIVLGAEDIVLQDPTQGTSSVLVVLGIPFGTTSYLQAETAALERQGSDVLIDRVRYAGNEGIKIPFIEWWIFGSRTYYVQGIGAKFTH